MLTWIGVICAIVGTVSNLYKKWWCFIFWFIANVILAYHNYNKIDTAQFYLFCFYQCTCIFGIYKWYFKKDKDER